MAADKHPRRLITPLTMQPLTMLSFFFNRSTAQPLQRVERFRGTAKGWQPIGSPRNAADARLLATMLQRVHPEATLRISAAA